ncbi:MlaD family protein [Hydrogenimonas sp.]
MESRAHYIVVGLFVLLLGAGAVFFALWMGRLQQGKVHYTDYYTYMRESVSGLPKDGDVKYMGVALGKVTDIYIDPQNPTYVRLTLHLPDTFVVREGMYATLKLTGITGIAYVEIVGGRPGARPIPHPKGKIPVIPSRPSLLSKVSDALPEVTVNVAEAFDRLNRLLDDDTIAKFQATVDHLESASARLDNLLGPRNSINAARLLQNLADASERIDRIYDAADAIGEAARNLQREGNLSLVKVGRSADAVAKLAEDLDRRIEAGEWDLRSTLRPTLAETDALLRETRTLVYELQEAVHQLKESPGDLLFKESAPLPGPGERE